MSILACKQAFQSGVSDKGVSCERIGAGQGRGTFETNSLATILLHFLHFGFANNDYYNV